MPTAEIELTVTAEQIGRMSLPELRAEMKKALETARDLDETIDTRGGLAPDDELLYKRHVATLEVMEKVEKTLSERHEQRTWRDQKLAQLNGHDDGRPPHLGGISRPPSPGFQFVESQDYKNNSDVFRTSMTPQFAVSLEESLEWKTVLFGSSDTSGGAFVVNDHQMGFVTNVPQREITLLPLIPRIPTSSDTVEWVRQDTYTNNAAGVVEATGSAATGTDGRKPESAIAFSIQTMAVRTRAHWLPVTNRMLADAPMIRGIIDAQLLLGLQLELEGQIVSGAGTGEDFTGLLNVAGIGVVSRGTDSQLDALFKGTMLVRTSGKGRATAIVVNPTDYQTIRLARENSASATFGGYLMGPPSVAGPLVAWGLPLVISEALPVGTALVADFGQACALYDREQSSIRVGTINDMFIRNMQAILAELRAAFVTSMPKLVVKVTGL